MTETEAGPDEDGPEYCPVCVRQLVYEVTWAGFVAAVWAHRVRVALTWAISASINISI